MSLNNTAFIEKALDDYLANGHPRAHVGITISAVKCPITQAVKKAGGFRNVPTGPWTCNIEGFKVALSPVLEAFVVEIDAGVDNFIPITRARARKVWAAAKEKYGYTGGD